MRSFHKRLWAALAVVYIAVAVAPFAVAGNDTASPDAFEGDEKKEQTYAEITTFSLVRQKVQSALAAAAEEDSPALIEIVVDGEDADPEYLAFMQNETTYVPVRSVCTALGAEEIVFDGATETVTVTAEGLEMVIPVNMTYLVANGRYLHVPDGFVLTDGRLMAPVRTLCTAFGATLIWDAEDAAVYISTGSEPILSGDEFYDADEVYWLSHIINAEAGDEPFDGKIAVGNVILNRVVSDEFPGSVYDVIFDHKSGVQFTPTVNGSIYMKIGNPGCEEAAKLALEGADVVGDALYFSSAYSSCWAQRNRPYACQIGTHAFYL